MRTPDGSTPTLGRRRLASEIADRILHTIRSDHVPAGGRLPTVAMLARRFDVAAHTVREALNQLDVLGVVEIRHGAGVFVADQGKRLMLANPFHQAIDFERIMALLETRSFIEPPLAAQAALHATDEDAATLGDLLAEAGQVLDGSKASNVRLNELNLAFHVGIARASGNSVASDVVDVLAKLYSGEQLALLPICEGRRPGFQLADHRGHLDLVERIRSSDAEGAHDAMQNHIAGVLDLLQAHHAESTDAS